jgi:hypothetical protein
MFELHDFSGLHIEVWDEDLVTDEFMGECLLEIPAIINQEQTRTDAGMDPNLPREGSLHLQLLSRPGKKDKVSGYLEISYLLPPPSHLRLSNLTGNSQFIHSVTGREVLKAKGSKQTVHTFCKLPPFDLVGMEKGKFNGNHGLWLSNAARMVYRPAAVIEKAAKDLYGKFSIFFMF